MKTLLSLLMLLCSLTAIAQSSPAPDSTERKLYVGVGLNTVSYMLEFSSNMRTLGGSIEPIVFPHIGYKLTPRLNVQVGVGYGKDNVEYGSSFYEDGAVTFETVHNNTKGWVAPVTVEFTPFNPHKRLQLYVTASIVPTYGSNYIYATRRRAGASTILDQDEASGFNTQVYNEGYNSFNVVATAGLTAKYKINKRLDSFVNGTLFHKNLHKRGELHHQKPKSAGIGINYNF